MISDKYKLYNPYSKEVFYNLRAGNDHFRYDLSRHWTGLVDKNGKEIYHGDILIWEDWEQELTDEPDLYIVDWDKEYARYYLLVYRDGNKIEDDEISGKAMKKFTYLTSIDISPDILA